MSRQENQEIKEYLVNFAISHLENCDVFVKTFGKKFARKMLALNLEKVYTNEKSDKGGYYDIKDFTITICKSGKNGELLKSKDIEEDDHLQETILHEAVHAILRQLKQKCNKMGIISGTGIFEIYEDGIERARGFNEGLTNWIVEKAGIKTNTYKNLTNIAKQIEIAIGKEETMKICKGDVKGNVAKRLNMDFYECIEFLAINDHLYFEEKRMQKCEKVQEILAKIRNKDVLYISNEEIKKLESEYSGLSQQFEQNCEYQKYIEDNNLEDDDETRLKYIAKEKESAKRGVIKARAHAESIIFDKYFKKEFEELLNSEDISYEDTKKYIDLRRNMETYEDDIEGSVVDFQRKLKILRKKYEDKALLPYEERLKQGELSIQELLELTKKLSYGNENEEYYVRRDVFNRISKLICSKNPEAVEQLIEKVIRDGNIEDINRYSFIEIEAEGLKNNVYMKDKRPVFSTIMSSIKKITANEEIKDQEDIFDYTSDPADEGYKNAISQFLKLKEKINERNQNAEISILNEVIVVDDNGKREYYSIKEGGIILPAEVKSKEPIKMNFAQSKEERAGNLPTVRKETRFSKLLLSIRKKLYRGNGSSSIIEVNDEENSINTKREKFKEELSDMSNYSELPTGEEVVKGMETTREKGNIDAKEELDKRKINFIISSYKN